MMSIAESGSALITLCVLSAASFSCRPLDMYDQPYYEPYEASDLFPDGRSARIPPAGTVPQGLSAEDAALRTDDENPASIPFRIQDMDMAHGRRSFNAFCSPCHGFVGRGDGMIVQRGFPKPPSLHEEYLRQAQDGHLFAVISKGFGTMPSYAGHLAPRDRWLVIAYIRALQISQNMPAAELSEADRLKLKGGP